MARARIPRPNTVLSSSQPFGSAGNGASPHLTGDLMGMIGGMRLQHIPSRGAAPALMALIVGDIAVLMDNLPTALPQIRGGAVVALAVISAARVPDLPDVPALGELGSELGLAGFESVAWFGLSAHASVSDANLARFVAAGEAAMADPGIRRQLAERGTTPTGGGPGRYAALIRAEREGLARVALKACLQGDSSGPTGGRRKQLRGVAEAFGHPINADRPRSDASRHRPARQERRGRSRS